MNRSFKALLFVSLLSLGACAGPDGKYGYGNATPPTNEMPKGYGIINQESMGLRPVLKPGRLAVTESGVIRASRPLVPVVEAEPLSSGADSSPGVWKRAETAAPRLIMPVRASAPVSAPVDVSGDGTVMVYPLDGAPVAEAGYEAAPAFGSDDLPVSIVGSDGIRLGHDGGGAFDAPVESFSFAGQPDASADTSVLFAYGSAGLGSAERARMVSAAKAFGGPIRVVGHASRRVDGVEDPVLRRIINLKMSLKRAEAVSAALYRAGIDPAQVETVGLGDARARSGGSEEADRRVDIVPAR